MLSDGRISLTGGRSSMNSTYANVGNRNSGLTGADRDGLGRIHVERLGCAVRNVVW